MSRPVHPEVSGYPLVDITKGDAAVPLFPTDVLPGCYAEFVEDVADRQQVPPDLVAIPVLVAAAAMVGRKTHIAAKRHDTTWRERACLWGGVIGPSGVGKTEPMREALRPLARLNAELREASKLAFAEWEAADKATRGPKPAREALMTNDTTVEGLISLMEHNPRGLLLYRDELTGWLDGLNQYHQGSGNDRPFYLECYSGGQYSKYRADQQRDAFLDDLYLCILGGIQPDVFRRRFKDGPQDGMLPRFGLLAYPVFGERCFTDVRPNFTAIRSYQEALAELRSVEARHPLTDGAGSGDLRLSGEAYSVWSRWADRHGRRPELRDEDSAFGAHLAKYAGLSKRLMLVLHFMRHGPAAPWEVAGATAEAVRRVIDEYLEPHAHRVYGFIDSHPARAGAVRIARWVLAGRRTAGTPKPIEAFTARDVRRCDWGEFKAPDGEKRIAQAIEHLEAMGWVDIEEGRRRGTQVAVVTRAALELAASVGEASVRGGEARCAADGEE